MKCAYCGTAVTPAAERCPQCEVPIVWDGDTAEFLVPEAYVPVFVANDPAMLPVIMSLFEANDIPFVVTDEVSQDFLSFGRVVAGYNPVTGPPVVKVPGRMVDAVRELIASASRTPGEAPPEP